MLGIGKKKNKRRTETFTKIIQGQNEPYIDFSQTLNSAVNRMMSDPEVKQILIKFLVLKMLIHIAER